jgi:3-hydroxymyristoyl/3-hydroxydecanoyl-(acyl carrier protein) dehydratase
VAQELPYLQGHFPGLPIVPAAVLLEISQAFLRHVLARPDLKARRARQCKFKGMVAPGESYRLAAEQEKPDHWRLTWTKTGTADGPVADIQLEV